MTTQQLIDEFRAQVSELTAANSHWNDTTQLVLWANAAQRRLAAVGQIMMTSHGVTSVAAKETYPLPPETIKVYAVVVMRPNDKYALRPLNLPRINWAETPGRPTRYSIWGANDSITLDNTPLVRLHPPFSDSGSSDDFFIYSTQLPKTMVIAGQGPEIDTQYQDAIPAYMRWKAFGALSNGSDNFRVLSLDAKNEWDEYVRDAKRFRHPMMVDIPLYPMDTMGYGEGPDYSYVVP